MIYSKKSIGPVIATTLILLGVMVAAAYLFDFIISNQLVFQNELEEEQNNLFSKPEITNVFNGSLYIITKESLEYDSISISNSDCSDDDKKLISGVNKINIKDCIDIDKVPSNFEVFLSYGGQNIRKVVYISQSNLNSID